MDPEEKRAKIINTYARRVELIRKVEDIGREKKKGVKNEKPDSR
jgi:hypothetical protein